MQNTIAQSPNAHETVMLFELLERADALFANAHSPEELDATKDKIVQEIECRCYARRLELAPLEIDETAAERAEKARHQDA